jgi:hypothetical protein
LLNADLVDNHVPDAGSLFRLEKEMLEFNFDFFTGGKILNCLKLITDFAEDKIIEILSQSLAQSSTLDGQPSTN